MDYRSQDGRHSIEVKELMTESYKDLSAAFRSSEHFDSEVLSGRWIVAIERQTLDSRLPPMPDFSEDDPQAIAQLALYGFTVKTKAEKQAEWRARHPGPARPGPRLRRLGRDLEPHLAVLEEARIGCTRGAEAHSLELRRALAAIGARTHDAICMRHAPLGIESPGIDIALADGSVRTGRADTIAARIELWLESSDSRNLRNSLLNEAGSTRHAVLVFDPRAEPEYQAAVEQGADFCPTLPIELPQGIDVLWFILGPVACWFTPSEGWESRRLPPRGAA